MILRRIREVLKWRSMGLVDGIFGRFYAHRHPGPVGRAVISLLSPLVRQLLPNDKWNLHVMVPAWIDGLAAPRREPLPPSRHVFIFVAYRGVFTSHLLLAVMLAWRGHRITLGYLPKLQSPNKQPLADSPTAKPYLKAALAQVERLSRGAIRTIDLSDDLAPVAFDETAVEKQARYDMVMALQRENIDMQDPAIRALLDHMNAAGRTAQIALRNHFSKHRYDICIVGNGTTFEGSHACRVLREFGHEVNGTEKFAFRGVRVINHGDHFLAGDDIGAIWRKREELGYTAEPYFSRFVAQALGSIRARSQNSTETWLWELQRAVDQSTAEAFRTAGIDPERPFVLVCPNVVFDAGYGKITNLFPTMREWLVQTVEYLLRETDEVVVVRAHPGEGLWWGGRDPVHQLLATSGISPGERLVIIPGQAKVNTYRLMERCLYGVVFSSSTGLEMATMGKHVAVASDVVYSHRGFTYDAKTRQEYFDHLKSLPAVAAAGSLDERRRDLALLFYFVYHWVAQYPYPYDKPTYVAQRSVFEQLSGDDMAQFLTYIDLIVMDAPTFEARMGDFLSAERILKRIEAAKA